MQSSTFSKLCVPILFVLVLSAQIEVVYAAEIQFSARVDQEQISLQDTVSLKLMVQVDNNASASEPEFNAPDFRVVNEFNSVSVQYDSTRGMQKSQEINVVLRPLKTGRLKISGIRIKADRQVLTADDLEVKVLPATAGPPQRSGLNSGLNNGLINGTGSGKIRLRRPDPQADPSVEKGAFIRAELDRSSGSTAVYKGQQIVLSYYLYHQMKVFNLQVDKFPILSGFLREDLEMPIMGQRLESETVTLKNEQYQRSLLARYAAYPLQEGNLDIDSMALKFNYYSNQRNSALDEDDPFFSFFQQLSPRAAAAESEHFTIQVLPLPQEGRPTNFVGGVGDFTVTSAVNKYEVKANEAISFVLKVEGRGNIASVQEPKSQWPSGIELYESKGKSQTGRSSLGQKVFEFLLIPRAAGKVQLPKLELGFFDPVQKRYYTKSTDPIEITVTDPSPSSSSATATSNNQPLIGERRGETASRSTATTPFNPNEPRGLKPILANPTVETGSSFIWRILYMACSVGFGILVILVFDDFFKKKRAARGPKPKWERLQAMARKAAANGAWKEVTEAYELLTDVILDAIDNEYGVGARAFSRLQLRTALLEERGLPDEIWNRLVALLEFTELVRFASSIGAISEADARARLAYWVSEGETIVKNITHVETGARGRFSKRNSKVSLSK